MNVCLTSSYKKYRILLSVKQSDKDTDIVFINIHGAFGESGDTGSKSFLLGNTLLKKGISHVVYISTSRNWDRFKKLSKENKYLAFENKTFSEERQDIIDAISNINLNAKKYFQKKNIQLYIVANSIGGTLLSTLVNGFSNIKKIVLCNSGIRSVLKDRPIISTIPESEVISKSASTFRGDLLFLQGTKDGFVPKKFQDELFEVYSSANATKKVINGANHTFSSIYGKDKKTANQIYINEIIDFFSK